MGYDENFYSVKSRLFVVSLASFEPLTVKIGDEVVHDYSTLAADLVVGDQLKYDGEGDYSTTTDEYTLFADNHPTAWCAYSYAYVN